jgi:integrase/recombinase XerD
MTAAPQVAELVDLYAQALEARGYSALTVKSKRICLHKFERFLVGREVGDLMKVTPAMLEDFRMEVMHTPTAKGLPPRAVTVNNALEAVRGLYRVLHELDLLPVDPARRLHLLKEPEQLPPPVLKVDEMARLLDSIDPSTPDGGRDRALFELMYSTGTRAGETTAMEVDDVDLDERMVRIRCGKGGKQRVVPFGEVAAAYLENYLRWCRPGLCRQHSRPMRALWLTMLGQPMGYFTVRARLRRYAEALGIDKRLTPHGLRHACATHLLERRAELRHIQELLGHASVATTQIYTHVSIGHLKETLQRCHPRERGNLEAEDEDDDPNGRRDS